ncbi:MAG TPA: hypothetical protein VG389_13755 [Myxococcota bacterium]|jgi:hypothetical protein|nr:hypothetical protein [Myxococcota bacterium]
MSIPAELESPEHVLEVVRRAQRYLALRAAGDALGRTLGWGMPLTAAAALGALLAPAAWRGTAAALAVVPLAVALAAAATRWRRLRPGMVAAAQRLDAALGSKDRVVSAYEFVAAGRTEGVYALAVLDALEKLEDVEPRQVLAPAPRPLLARVRLATLAAVALVAAAALGASHRGVLSTAVPRTAAGSALLPAADARGAARDALASARRRVDGLIVEGEARGWGPRGMAPLLDMAQRLDRLADGLASGGGAPPEELLRAVLALGAALDEGPALDATAPHVGLADPAYPAYPAYAIDTFDFGADFPAWSGVSAGPLPDDSATTPDDDPGAPPAVPGAGSTGDVALDPPAGAPAPEDRPSAGHPFHWRDTPGGAPALPDLHPEVDLDALDALDARTHALLDDLDVALPLEGGLPAPSYTAPSAGDAPPPFVGGPGALMGGPSEAAGADAARTPRVRRGPILSTSTPDEPRPGWRRLSLPRGAPAALASARGKTVAPADDGPLAPGVTEPARSTTAPRPPHDPAATDARHVTEAALYDETIDAGRKDYLRRYFLAIRPAE